jgi:hypothetical protein
MTENEEIELSNILFNHLCYLNVQKEKNRLIFLIETVILIEVVESVSVVVLVEFLLIISKHKWFNLNNLNIVLIDNSIIYYEI